MVRGDKRLVPFEKVEVWKGSKCRYSALAVEKGAVAHGWASCCGTDVAT
jgi:hypothetical protein